MPLQIEVTKISVSERMDALWNITLNLTCWPDGVVKEYPIIVEGILDMKNAIIYRNFSTRYRPGQSIQTKVQTLFEQMQETIDDYKGEKQIFDASQLDTTVTWLGNNLVG